ncbi:hypothetical protein Tco_0958920 [Tanacetum coccineum]
MVHSSMMLNDIAERSLFPKVNLKQDWWKPLSEERQTVYRLLDFKYLYPSDFEDLYLLNLQGHLDHLPPKDKRFSLPSQDKKILSTAVNLWIRNLVIRQRVEDFQLGIESFQTQLNLTKPRWDATGFEFKHDLTVIDSIRAVTFRDKYEGGSSVTWKALLVEESERETTDFGREPNDHIISTIKSFTHYYCPSYSELVDIEKVTVCSSLRPLKSKRAIESRAMRSSTNLARTLTQNILESPTVAADGQRDVNHNLMLTLPTRYLRHHDN